MKPWLLFLAALLVFPSGAWAQRNLPKDAYFATVTAFSYPQVRFDKLELRLAPGGKIYNEHNLIIMPAAMPPRPSVLFRLDSNGDVSSMWILTSAEASRFKKTAPKPPKSGKPATDGGFKDPPRPPPADDKKESQP
jgi:hypothetical protein